MNNMDKLYTNKEQLRDLNCKLWDVTVDEAVKTRNLQKESLNNNSLSNPKESPIMNPTYERETLIKLICRNKNLGMIMSP